MKCILVSLYFRPPTRKTTYPEVALGSVENLNGDTESGVLRVGPPLHALCRMRDERTLDRRKADYNGLLDGVVPNGTQRVHAEAEGRELALLLQSA